MNHASSHRAFTTFFYIAETSVPDTDIDVLKKKFKYIYIFSSQRHVKTPHAYKTSAYRAKGNLTSYVSDSLSHESGNFWYDITTLYLYNCKKKKKKLKKKVGKKGNSRSKRYKYKHI